MPASSVGNDVDIDIGALFASLWRNKLRILVGSLLLTALAFLLLSLVAPKYRAETRILIETGESVFTRPANQQADDRPVLDQEGIKSQVELIGSSDLLKRVIARLDLAKNPELSAGAEPSVLSRLFGAVGIGKNPDEDARDDYILQSVRDRLLVYNVAASRVIVIQFSSKDAALSASIANAIADEYVATQQLAKSRSNTDAAGWLQPEIADLSKRVKEAEAKVAAYRSSSDLLIGQNNAVLATQQLSELSSELSRVRANRAASEASAESVRAALAKGAPVETLPAVMASPLIQRLRERQVQLNNDIADLSASLLSGHPRIRALRSQLADLNNQIRLEARKVLGSLENEAETARLRESQLTSSLNELKAQASKAGEEEVELRALEREATAQRQLLESYLTRYREASSRTDRGYLPADARIFSRADRPIEPYFPKKIPMTVAAFVASLLLLSIVTLLRALFSGQALRPAYPQPATEVLLSEGAAAPAPVDPAAEPARTETENTPSLAASIPAAFEEEILSKDKVPSAQFAAPAADLPATDAPVADHSGIANVAARLMASGAARAVVVSPEGDEASALTILLVRELADRGVRVILVDMTGSGEIGRSMLEDKNLPGITDLLVSEKHFSDVIHPDHYSQAELIPLGNHDPAKAMQSVGRLPMILNALQSAYDLVVVDAGPATVVELKHLLADGTELILGLVDPDDPDVAATAKAVYDAKLLQPELLTPFDNGELRLDSGRIVRSA
ncbi:GumC family protein [Phyllobacterium endophyticum]|uniref:Chain-length determining protein n=1 Tax=Phyllobacterium endophyticum TaxID=1149773 RepID=A0A2P7AWB6_9HYPH|nr:Wzz/FepE/Etk N-terminal domain-containing protein [Phyllobacterium endophyticum]MBB3235098.1 exopolysaccharide transport family protein [Phyllobacterium endophyticum]PSH58493.1 chain-length determining protein [Phyllobacterium endophyticum]TYR39170.1 chain-length determining protein [Phyllobacterium endophyticum]